MRGESIEEARRPHDHNERMANMRKAAQWLLGDPSWADTLMSYYDDLNRDAEEEW